MPKTIRDRMTYANVTATLALFIALGGSSYAALSISSGDIKNNTVRSRDLRNNDVRGKDVRNGSLTGKDVKRDGLGGVTIKESRLGTVPNANKVGGKTADALRVKCPGGTVLQAGTCMETAASAPTNYPSAGDACEVRQRQLPSWTQLKELFDDGTSDVSPAGEFTSSVYEGTSPGPGNPKVLRVVVVTTNGGSTVFQDAFTPTPRAFRCVVSPTN